MSEPKLTSNNFENHCGHIVNANMKFCPECGAEIINIKKINESIAKTEQEIISVKDENQELKIKIEAKKKKLLEKEQKEYKKEQEKQKQKNHKKFLREIDKAESSFDLLSVGRELVQEYDDIDNAYKCLQLSINKFFSEQTTASFKDWIELLNSNKVKESIVNYYNDYIYSSYSSSIPEMLKISKILVELFNDFSISDEIIEDAKTLLVKDEKEAQKRYDNINSYMNIEIAKNWIEYFNDFNRATENLKTGFKKFSTKNFTSSNLKNYINEWLVLTNDKYAIKQIFKSQFSLRSIYGIRNNYTYISNIIDIWKDVFFDDDEAKFFIYDCIKLISTAKDGYDLFGIVSIKYPWEQNILKSILYKTEQKCYTEDDYNLLALNWSGIDKKEQERIYRISDDKFY